MKKISVVVVDDHPFFRQGLCLYFENNRDIEIVDEFKDGKEVLQFMEKNNSKIDVVIMDFQMPDMDGGETTRIIGRKWPEVKVLVLTSYGSWDKVYSLLNSGASGYLLKDANPEKLAAAIKAVYTGGTYFGSQVKEALLHNVNKKKDSKENDFSDLIEPLTDREVDIIKLIGQGMGNVEIADKLFISNNTVKTHVSHIFQKLNVNSRTEAAFYAMQKGLIES